jgi:MFS family permease
MDTVGMFGGVAGPALVVAFFVLSFPWEGIFLVAGLVSIGLVVGFHRIAQSEQEDEKPQSPPEVGETEAVNQQPALSYAKAFLNFDIVMFVVIVSLFSFTWSGISAFLPLFLINEKGFSVNASGLLFSGFFVVSVSQIVTGELSDRLGRLVVVLGIIGLTVASLVLLLVFSSKWVVVVVVLVMGAAFHGIRPARDSHLMDIIPTSLGGGVLGMVRTAMTGIGAVAPAAMGFMADQVGLAMTFIGVVLVLLFCGVLTIVLIAKTSRD